MSKKGTAGWQNSKAAGPKTRKTTGGSVISEMENWEDALLAGLSASERESLSLSMNATDTAMPGDPTTLQRESLSARDIWENGSELTVWNLSPQVFLNSGAILEFFDPNELGEKQSRRLGEFAFGIGLNINDTIRDICKYLEEGGFHMTSGTVKEAVLFYLDNYYYGA